MGLFIGASILTVLELFDYLYEVKYQAVVYSNAKCVPRKLVKREFEINKEKKQFFTAGMAMKHMYRCMQSFELTRSNSGLQLGKQDSIWMISRSPMIKM